MFKHWTKLEVYVRTLQPCKQSMRVCCLHTVSRKIQKLRLKENASTFSVDLRCCYSSNIVKSPFKDIDIPNKLVHEMIWDAVDRSPESIALKCTVSGQEYTYAEVQKLSLRLANSFLKSGFRKGEVVSLISPNCPDFPIAILGTLEAGLAVSFANHIYTVDEIYYHLKDSGSVCVMVGANQLSTVQAAIKKLEESTKTKPVRRIVVLDMSNRVDSVASGVTRYSEMIADGIDQSRTTNSTQVNDLALLLYSSGTTGLSKGVCLSHGNIVANTCQIGAVEGAAINSSEKGQDVVLGLLPFFHVYGLVAVLLSGLQHGAKVVTLPKFDPRSLIQALGSEKLSFLMVVPPILWFLASSPHITPNHLMNVRHIISATAPIGASDSDKLIAKLPQSAFVSQAYGLTETSPVVLIPKVPIKNFATVGAPVSKTLAKVISTETGDALGPNQRGELFFKGPQVMVGYHNNPKATAEMIDADGWLQTGDIGYYDEDSHFYIVDRLKDLIKVKGFQVPPAELENLLRTHPSVSDVGVIGVPDPKSGEVPVAFVVPEKEKKPTDKEIKDFLSEKLSKHKQVSEVIFVDSIPRNTAGKILRKKLREAYENTK